MINKDPKVQMEIITEQWQHDKPDQTPNPSKKDKKKGRHFLPVVPVWLSGQRSSRQKSPR
jgi:hypothetical protein